jgi:hypothetical protein
MSRKRRKNRRKPRAHFVEDKRDHHQEQEFLNSEVNLGTLGHYGDDALVRAIVYELPEADEQEAMEIALAVQKRLRGDASLLEAPELSEDLDAIREEAAEIDRAAEAWEKDQQNFIEDAFRNAPKLSKEQREKLAVKGREQWKQTVSYLKAGKHTKQLHMMDQLQREPLEEIHVMGRTVMKKGKPRILPDVVRVLGIRFTLTPGIHKVPMTIANAYRELLKQRAYSEAKHRLWRGERAPGGIWDIEDIDRQLRQLNEQYGVVMEDLYTGG